MRCQYKVLLEKYLNKVKEPKNRNPRIYNPDTETDRIVFERGKLIEEITAGKMFGSAGDDIPSQEVINALNDMDQLMNALTTIYSSPNVSKADKVVIHFFFSRMKNFFNSSF